MTSRTLTLIAFAAGTLYALTGVIELGYDQPDEFTRALDYVIEALFVAALALSVVLLWELRGTGHGTGATVAFLIAAAGNAVILVAATATLVSGAEALDPVFPLGILLVMGGYVALLILDWRGRLGVPRSGVALALSFVLAAFLDEPTSGAGGLLLGAGWYALARLIQLSEETPTVVESSPWRDRDSITPPA